uniref:Disease resistance N-terminal domain-containing protein n=1 Tax=Oryza punctata TaxID=4537 RepID=A0A0E0KF65_ORYPU
MEGIVVTAAEGAVKTLLGKLGSVLSQEPRLIGGVRGELQYIKDELESMNAFLQNLAATSSHTVQVKIWMKQVREMAYDAEDCIDEFQQHFGGYCGNVQELKVRARDVSDRYARYSGANAIVAASSLQNAANSVSTCLSLDPRQVIGFIQDDLLVGIDTRRDRVLTYLREGRLGKTTLAKAIYDNPQKFDLKAILGDMLGQLIPPASDQHVSSDIEDEHLKAMEVWDVKRLSEKLRSYLADKSIFPEDYKIKRKNVVRQWVAEICALFHLKYLSLRRAQNIDRLPRKIKKLQSLGTLDLRGTGFTYLLHGFGRMKSIQTLGFIISDDTSWRIQEIDCLMQLEKLRIRSPDGMNKENWASLLTVIENLSRCLRSLSIETDGRTCSLPLDFSSSPPLLLQSLLLYGRLLWFAFAVEKFVVAPSGFPNLQLLAIQGWNGPLQMILEEGAMQKLHMLVLVASFRDATLKSTKGTKYLRSLRTVEIRAKSTPCMEALLDELRLEASHLPNHPTVIIKRA